MAYTKRTWLGRQGTGLNKFSIGGATPVTIVNQPDSVTQVGDALSAGNLNDLEDRIEDAFDDVDTELDTKADEQEVTNLNNAITAIDHRVQNIEQSKGDYIVASYKDGSTTPSGKGKWCVVEGVEGVSRVANNLLHDVNSWSAVSASMSVADGVVTFTRTGDNYLGYQVIPVENGHKYILAIEVMASEACNVTFSNAIGFGSASVLANTWTKLYFIQNASFTSSAEILRVNAGVSNGGTLKIKDKAVITDLTVYFAGDPSVNVSSFTIADIQRDYPHLLLPSDYGTRIVDWTGNGVRAYSNNLINEADYSQLALLTYADDYFSNTTADTRTFFQLAVQAVISGGTQTLSQINVQSVGRVSITFTTPSAKIETLIIKHNGSARDFSARFEIDLPVSTQMTLSMDVTGYNPTVAGGVRFGKLQLEEGTTATDYTPYGAIDTLSFPSTSLKSAGSVREKKLLNVEVEIDGQKVQKSVKTNPLKERLIADPELNYTKAGGIFYALLSDAKPVADSNVKANILCDKFFATSRNGMTQKGQFSISSSGSTVYINFYWDDVSIDAFKTAMADVYFRYELATPDPDTYSDPIIDNTLLTEAYGRMSTVQTGTVVDGIADLGFITL